MDITQILKFAAQQDASDVHISAGEPPMLRIHGSIKKLKVPALTESQTQEMMYDIMNDGQRKIFEETNDVDFAIEVGDALRLRVNVFRQKRGVGGVFRKIPTTILTMEQLGLPDALYDIAQKSEDCFL